MRGPSRRLQPAADGCKDSGDITALLRRDDLAIDEAFGPTRGRRENLSPSGRARLAQGPFGYCCR
jgi:hypothetical protein